MTISNHLFRSKYLLRSKQRGTFSIELALIGLFMSFCMVFVSDMAGKQTLKGHLQRLSHSAVNIIKERTQFYPDKENIDTDQVTALFSIVSNSMERSMSGFDDDNLGIQVEQLTYDSDWSDDPDDTSDANNALKTSTEFSKGYNCSVANTEKLESSPELHFDSEWGNMPALYQVTLCYRDNNWFGKVAGETNDYVVVKSHSIMLGR